LAASSTCHCSRVIPRYHGSVRPAVTIEAGMGVTY
jgi:hypothetical protein